jgi:alkylated DNA repair dioxygenase AlkB
MSIPQLSLFEPFTGVLVDDAHGRVEYRPGFVPPTLARAWFDAVRGSVPWKAERRRMYDRDVDVPRLTGHYHLDESGLPPALADAAAQVIARTGVAFNSVGLNLYRDGRDSVAPHNDHLDVLVPGHPIALLSLGSARRMVIRGKEPPRRVLNVDLEPGSLLLMSYATQLHYTHGIPKTTETVGERISLAFRVKPARTESDDEADPYR